MAWRIHAEHPEHFEVHGSRGLFMVAKAKLSPSTVKKMRSMCEGGPVRMADGGDPASAARRDSLLGPERSREAAEALRRYDQAPRLLLPDGRQVTQDQLDQESQRKENTAKLDSLLGAPLAAGAYGALDTLGASPETRDAVTGALAGGEAIAYGGAMPAMAHQTAMAKALRAQPAESPAAPASQDGRPDTWDLPAPKHVVFHGSPHDFERFSMEKIGTGEGHQTYGHGLYFAENPEVANTYRSQLAPFAEVRVRGVPAHEKGQQYLDTAAEMVPDHGPQAILDRAKALALRDMGVTEYGNHEDVVPFILSSKTPSRHEQLQDILSWLKGINAKHLSVKKPGALYAADVPGSRELLDYDKPMADQAPGVRDRVLGLLESLGFPRGHRALSPETTGRIIYDDLGYMWHQDRADALLNRARDVYHRSADTEADQARMRAAETEAAHIMTAARDNAERYRAASHALKEVGVPGLQYLDEGSRAKREGTHNVVIWSDSRISRHLGKASHLDELQKQLAQAAKLRGDDMKQFANGGAVPTRSRGLLMPFRVVREEAPHFVIKGNAGEFKVHSGSLSPSTVERMRALCRGGAVTPMAKGGPVKMYEGEAVPVQPDLVPLVPPAPAPAFDEFQMQREAAIDQGAPGTPPMQPDPALQTARRVLSGGNDPAPEPTALPSGGGGNDAPAPAAQLAPAPSAPTPKLPALPKLPAVADWDKQQGMVDASLTEGKAGADRLAKAEAQKANDLTSIQTWNNEYLKRAHEKRVSDLQEAQREIDRVASDVAEATIKPNRFLDEAGAGGKIAAALGMILSGIGSGLTGQPNMAMAFLQKQIDRDIDAQKANLHKKETTLGFMFKRYGNIQDAAKATESYLMAAMAGQVALIGARAGSEEALAKADMLKSQLTHGALQAQGQIIQGRHADAMQRYQMELSRYMMATFAQQSGSGAQPQGYLPSRARPPMGSDPSNPLKYAAEGRKDADDRTMLGPGGKPFLAYTKNHVEKYGPMLQASDNVAGALAQMEQLARNHTGLPGTDAADLYSKYRHGIVENWGRASGNAQPSEVISRNLESVMPTSWDAFVKGGVRFQPIKRMLKEHTNNIYLQSGLHPNAIPKIPENERVVPGVGGH